MGKATGWTLIGLLLAVVPATGVTQVATTQIADTIYHADGTPASGRVLISWPTFTDDRGEIIQSGSTSAAIGPAGAVSVQLIPNAGSTPIGSYYTAIFHLDDGSTNREYWVVPATTSPVKISAIESSVLPASLAMQTVSKNYVDTAIAAAVTGNPLGLTSYIAKAGDTMSGPLLLGSDPVALNQAADKNYVDQSIYRLSGGLAQRISVQPSTTQTVAQPTGTQLKVNDLNNVEYASQYVTGLGSNGIANAVTNPDCNAGCHVDVERDYPTNESYSTASLNSRTHVTDERTGGQVDSYLNPLDVVSHGLSIGQTIDIVSTQSESTLFQQTGNQVPGAIGLSVTQEAPAGGSNLFPQDVPNSVPYFKMAYSAMSLKGTYNTQGQHGLVPEEIDCFGVGDCLLGSRFINASGGFRDNADEGAHLYDTNILEDSRVWEGGCVSGCTTGSTSVTLRQDSGGGTQGDGRFLIDKNAAKVITSLSTGGALIGGTIGTTHATALFAGTSFPISRFLSTGQAIASQASNAAPGTVTFQIATAGVPSGYGTSTSTIGSSSGLACVVDQNSSDGTPHNYEMAPFSIIDGTHLQMTLGKPHKPLATLAFGGLCGYGLEQTVDTANGIRQIFPIVGAYSPTGLYYAAGSTAVVGAMNETGGFLNVSGQIASLTRNANVVTVTTVGNLPLDLNGLTVTVSGVSDSTYNGNYTVSTVGQNAFTYNQSGPDGSSGGGTVAYLTGGFVLYPMAEVLSVFNPTTKSVDGFMTLAPNNVAWALNDPVEQPHYYEELVTADTEFVGQTVPRPTNSVRAGVQYVQNNTAGLTGWSIYNASPQSNYIGYGGTHNAPDAAYESVGVWRRTMSLAAGEQAAFAVHCNLHGCGNWNSSYDLFQLDSTSGFDSVNYSPSTSSLRFNMRGVGYSLTPQALTAGTIDVGILNATTVNGSLSGTSITSGLISPAVLPLLGPSGTGHAAGVAPDPGATAGNTRFLREDGAWATPNGSGGSGGGSGSYTIIGGSIDGTVIGSLNPAAVSATQLNGLPVSEYTNVARKPLTTLLQSLHNAKSQAVNIVVFSDSFGICDYANCGAGPTISADRYTEQLRINLQSQYGSHGTGMVPLVAIVGPTLNSEEWSVSGTWGTVNTLGPYQLANLAGSSLIHLANGAVATFTSAVPYDTINTYCMTSSSSGSIAVAIDGVSVGTACGSTTSIATAHATTSVAASLGTHVTTFTSNGDSYLYAAEGTAGTTGVSVHNLSVGSAAAEWFGLNPATQLAFSDLIPSGTQGVITMLQTNEPGVGYSTSSFTTAMNAMIAHEKALSGSPSVMMVVPPVDIIAGTAPYTAAQIAIAQQQNVAFVNVQDRWGSTYIPSSGLWDLGAAAAGIHPNDKGSRDEYSMIYAQLVDPVPFGAVSLGPATSIGGLVTAGAGVTITGSGTSTSPYSIASTTASGGCTTNCTFTGSTTLSSGSSAVGLTVSTTSPGGAAFILSGAGGGHTWGFDALGNAGPGAGDFAMGDFTQGFYPFRIHAGPPATGASYTTLGFNSGYCWDNSSDGASGTPDTCISRPAAGGLSVGNGILGDASGSLSAGLYKGPATAPSGGCSTVGWALSQDGHVTFCNGTAWVSKL